MSRKSSSSSLNDWLQRDFDRWRLLARNLEFRKDLVAYVNGCGKELFPSLRKWPLLSLRLKNRFQRLRQQYLHKWGITRLPDADLWPEESDFTLTPERLDRWYELQREEEPAFTTSSDPVFMTRDRQSENPPCRLIEFNVDPRLPIDQILAFLDKQLRSWYWDAFGPHRRGKPASIDRQIKVYDCVQGSEGVGARTFTEVARALRQPVSTIRDAYYAALTKIGIGQAPSLRSVPLPGPIEECTQCQKAKNVKEMCTAHQRYVTQDHGSQKDRPKDISAIEHGAAPQARSRTRHGLASDCSDN